MAEVSEVGTESDVNSELELIAEAEIGNEAKRFRESELGKTILGMALQETRAAEEELGEIDPLDTKKLMALQNQARLGRRFDGWLMELINKGEEALTMWKERHGDQNG